MRLCGSRWSRRIVCSWVRGMSLEGGIRLGLARGSKDIALHGRLGQKFIEPSVCAQTGVASRPNVERFRMTWIADPRIL